MSSSQEKFRASASIEVADGGYIVWVGGDVYVRTSLNAALKVIKDNFVTGIANEEEKG